MLELIDLDIEALGYTKFISAWVYAGDEGSFLVDPGPACTMETLLAALDRLGVRHLDWILLTHIHMDHAGGIGHIIEHFPHARVVCHEKAVGHLVDPARLWEGSRKVLGEVAEVYGPIQPVAESRIVTPDRLDFGEGIDVIDTPGHAAHHQCFAHQGRLFCGELFGVFLDLGERIYLRPATPPRFNLERFLASMDRAAPYGDCRLCFAHYGACADGAQIMEMARQQLIRWVEVIGAHRKNPDTDIIISDLIAQDPVFARIHDLPEELYQRERFFAANAVSGILQYLAEAAS